jgi:hypothetical protein
VEPAEEKAAEPEEILGASRLTMLTVHFLAISRSRISCHAALDEAAYAPFSEERRTKFAKATKFHWKSGKPRISCHAALDEAVDSTLFSYFENSINSYVKPYSAGGNLQTLPPAAIVTRICLLESRVYWGCKCARGKPGQILYWSAACFVT